MQSTLHFTAKVLSGNRIEVQLPSGSEGQEVEIFIVMPMKNKTQLESAITLTQITQEKDQLDIIRSTEALARIRSRPRINPLEFGLPDSAALIQEDRNR